MKFNRLGGIVIGLLLIGLIGGGCSRLLPAKKGSAISSQLVLDTRRIPVATLSGCFIPAIYPAITKIPIIFVQKIPTGATFVSTTVEIVGKNGEMAVLEPVIENNQVYLKFAVPKVDSFTQFNVYVHADYKYY